MWVLASSKARGSHVLEPVVGMVSVGSLSTRELDLLYKIDAKMQGFWDILAAYLRFVVCPCIS